MAALGIIGFFAFLPKGWGVQHEAMGLMLDASHFPAFFVLAILVFRWKKPTNGSIYSSALICLVLAILIELIQPWMDRQASFYDVVTSIAGATAGLIGVSIWKRHATRRTKLVYAGLVTCAIIWFTYPAMLLWGTLAW